MAHPVVAARNTTVDNVDGTSHTINMPAGIVAGNILLVVCTADGNTTITDGSATWSKKSQTDNTTGGTTPSVAVFSKVAAGSDTLTLTTAASEKITAISWRITGGGTVECAANGAAATGNSTNSDPPNFTPTGGSKDYLWIAVRGGDDGVDQASAAPTNYTNLTTATGDGAGGTATASGERALTASSENPGAFTSPTEQWVAYTIAIHPGSSGYTIAADGATYAVTGTSASLEFGREVAADGASYSIAGQSATLRRALPLSALGGTYTVTGTAASLEYGREVAADGGSYAVSGTDASLERGYEVAADGAAYAVTGSDASLEYGREVAADAGSYAVTGTAATLTYGQAGSYTISVDPGSYTLTGQAASLEYGREIAADGASYAIAGTDASLNKGQSLSALGGAYSLAGTDASLIFGRIMSGTGGEYIVVGSNATLQYGGPEPEPEPEPPVVSYGGGGGGFRGSRNLRWPAAQRKKWEERVLREIRKAFGTDTPPLQEVVEAVAEIAPRQVDPRAVAAVVAALVPAAPRAEVKAAVALVFDAPPEPDYTEDNNLMMVLAAWR